MQKKKNTRLGLSFIDIIVFMICACGIIFALRLFYSSVNMTFAKNNEKPVGMIYFKKNTAQRRFVDRNLWERLRESSPLYNGDRIRTSDLSEAVAVFQDGTRIEIHENTLLQIFAYNNEAMINFESGDLSVQAAASASPVKIATAEQEITVTADSVAAVKLPKKVNAESEQGVVAVLAGDVVIKNVVKKAPVIASKNAAIRFVNRSFDAIKDQLSITSNLDTSTVVESSAQTVSYGAYQVIGTSNVEKRPLAVLSPSPSQSVIAKTGDRPIITWFWVADKAVLLEFAREASFNPIIATCKLQSANGKENVTLPPVQDEEPLFWRMVSPNDKKNPVISSGVILPQKKPEVPQETLRAVFGESMDAAPFDALASAAISSVVQSMGTVPSVVAESSMASDSDLVQSAQLLDSKQQPSLFELEQRLAKVTVRPEKTESVIQPIVAQPSESVENLNPVPIAKEVVSKKDTIPVAKKTVSKKKSAIPKVTVKKASQPKKSVPAVPKAIPPAKKAVPANEGEQPKKNIPATPAIEKTPVVVKKANLILPGILPVLKSPASNFVFTENELGSGFIVFSWNPVSGTTGYVLELYKGTKCLLSKKVNTSSFTLKDLSLLEPGDFTWSVRGQGMESGVEQETKIASAPFSVRITALEELEIDTSELIPSR